MRAFFFACRRGLRYSAAMAHTPNRLESNWSQIKPRILAEWPQLTAGDLDRTEKQYDKLVHFVRENYGGRVDIIQEASIRTTLNRILAEIEE